MKKILLIEDDEVIGKMIFDELTKNGFSVIKAVDAMQGQQAITSSKPDLIVLDLMLPAGNGMEVLHNLRASFQTQSSPVIVITSFKDEEVKKEVEGYGIQGFIYKPFEPQVLLKEINRVLGQ